MFTIQICSSHTLEHHCHSPYRGIAYDGCYFYFTNPQEYSIAKCDLTFTFIEEITVQRRFTSLCFDANNECFCALSNDEQDRIYVLDTAFREIESISIKNINLGVRFNHITGITCGVYGQITICGNFGIAKVERCNPSKVSLIQKPKNSIQYTSIENIEEGYLCTFNQSQCQLIGVVGFCDKEQIEGKIPEQFCVEDITGFVCNKESCRIYYLLVRKGECCSCILKIKVCYDKNCDQNKCDILESIALIETAIAHILNAEGEKIQKILSVSDDPCEILKVNEMVNQTLIHVTQLETVLCEKLKLVNESCHNPSDGLCKNQKY